MQPSPSASMAPKEIPAFPFCTRLRNGAAFFCLRLSWLPTRLRFIVVFQELLHVLCVDFLCRSCPGGAEASSQETSGCISGSTSSSFEQYRCISAKLIRSPPLRTRANPPLYCRYIDCSFKSHDAYTQRHCRVQLLFLGPIFNVSQFKACKAVYW
jgi:hypothetical protein